MPPDQTSASIAIAAAAFIVVATAIGGAFGAFMWCRALIKVANVMLVFKQAQQFGLGAAPPARAEERPPRLPTRARMADEITDDDLHGAVIYEDDPDASPDDRDDDGKVRTMDENAGYSETTPHIAGRPVVGNGG